MKENIRGSLSEVFRRTAIAIGASGIMAATAVHAHPSNNIVLVPPTDLPTSAQQGGDAMFLRETIDGKTLLYIEQNQGARLATFDVTDPAHVRGAGSVKLDVSGPFDFVSSFGNEAELVRFRQNHQDAVLDLHKVPSINPVRGLTFQDPQTARDDQLIETAYSQNLSHVLGVEQVREKVTDAKTGTTYLLTENGLYLIRRPNVEWTHQLMVIPPN
jgi:hypothetical protein